MATTYLSRTATSGNNTTGTFSAWIKRGNLSSTQCPIGVAVDGNNFINIQFNSSNQLNLRWYDDGSPDANYNTTAVFRDASAWYHVVIAFDTTQSTSSDRVKIYVNNTQYSLSGYPPQNNTIMFNTASATLEVGSSGFANSIFDGSMAHVHWIDGTQYQASDFGETDATTGIWKPKGFSGSYGTNGFFLKFENSGAFGTDSSGNSNNFTVNGTMTQTIDTPSNVFCTMNALDNYFTGGTFTNGNTTVQMTNQPAHYTATFGASTGKWYWEGKMSAGNNSAEYNIVGVAPNVTDQSGYAGALGAPNHGVGLRGNGNVWYNDSQPETGWNTWNQGDIVMIALDLDNQKIFWGTNGTWGKSSDPVTGTNGFSISGKEGSKSSGFWFPAGCCREISQTNTFQWNFGNGYFGTTAVSSAQNPDDGIGIFEYDVPTGYKALCTKSINAEEYD